MEISKKEYLELKKKCASAEKGEVFIFKGQEVLKDYGDYLVEYLKDKF